MGLLKKTYTNIINLTAGFRYRARQPIDDRLVVDDKASLDELVSQNEVYKGMVVSVVNDKTESNNGTYHYIKQSNNDTFTWIKMSDKNDITDNVLYLNGGNAQTTDTERYKT